MPHKISLLDLENFAKEEIAADQYPNDYHLFHPFACDACGIVPFTLTIEHHTGSSKGNFKGVIRGTCPECGVQKSLLSFTGRHREPEWTETPACACGNDRFVAGELERIEGDDGMMGFFDEGVVVGQCTQCGKNRVFVQTD